MRRWWSQILRCNVFSIISGHDTYTRENSFPVHFRWNFRQKINPKNFYCTKRFVIEFQRESLELFLSYLVYFRRYRHFRPSSLKKAKIHATVKFPTLSYLSNLNKLSKRKCCHGIFVAFQVWRDYQENLKCFF